MLRISQYRPTRWRTGELFFYFFYIDKRTVVDGQMDGHCATAYKLKFYGIISA